MGKNYIAIIAVQCKNRTSGGSVTGALQTLSSGTQCLIVKVRESLLSRSAIKSKDLLLCRNWDSYSCFYESHKKSKQFLFNDWIRIALLKVPETTALQEIYEINQSESGSPFLIMTF